MIEVTISANNLQELWAMLSAFDGQLTAAQGGAGVGSVGPGMNNPMDPPPATKPKRGRPPKEEATATATATATTAKPAPPAGAGVDVSERLADVVNELTTIFMQARNDGDRDTADLIVSGRDELNLKKLGEAKAEQLGALEDLLAAVQRVAAEGSGSDPNAL